MDICIDKDSEAGRKLAEEARALLGPERIADLQNIVDGLARSPAHARYVAERKLELFDSRMKFIDDLLKIGVLTDPFAQIGG